MVGVWFIIFPFPKTLLKALSLARTISHWNRYWVIMAKMMKFRSRHHFSEPLLLLPCCKDNVTTITMKWLVIKWENSMTVPLMLASNIVFVFRIKSICPAQCKSVLPLHVGCKWNEKCCIITIIGLLRDFFFRLLDFFLSLDFFFRSGVSNLFPSRAALIRK